MSNETIIPAAPGWFIFEHDDYQASRPTPVIGWSVINGQPYPIAPGWSTPEPGGHDEWMIMHLGDKLFTHAVVTHETTYTSLSDWRERAFPETTENT